MSKVFHGLDYQGRHEVPKHLKGCWYGPHIERGQVMSDEQIEAAHAATGEGEEYDSMEGAGVVVTPVVIIALIAVIGFVTWVVQ